MLMPEADLEMTSQTGQQITVNRFQLLSRVGQVFLVDATSLIVENRLNYIRTHQARLLSQDVAEVEGADHDEDPPRGDEVGGGEADEGEIDHHEDNGPGFDVDDEGNPIAGAQPRRTFLPSSFTGSVRHLRKLAANALALVSASGKPTEIGRA